MGAFYQKYNLVQQQAKNTYSAKYHKLIIHQRVPFYDVHILLLMVQINHAFLKLSKSFAMWILLYATDTPLHLCVIDY